MTEISNSEHEMKPNTTRCDNVPCERFAGHPGPCQLMLPGQQATKPTCNCKPVHGFHATDCPLWITNPDQLRDTTTHPNATLPEDCPTCGNRDVLDTTTNPDPDKGTGFLSEHPGIGWWIDRFDGRVNLDLPSDGDARTPGSCPGHEIELTIGDLRAMLAAMEG
jgi:hypothetical protein